MANESLIAKTLVKETSTTTGTGAYTLAGAVSGFRTFNAAYDFNEERYIPYVARMGSNWEVGIGRLTSATAMTRTKILESSNANAAVNWGAGSKTITCTSGGLGAVPGRHNIEAGVPPVPTTDKYTEGYGPGSLWFENDTIYMCRHGGLVGGTMAAWVLVAAPTALQRMNAFDATGAFVDTASTGSRLGSMDDYLLDDTVYGVTGTGLGGKARWPNTRVHGLGYSAGSDYGAYQLVDGVGFAGATSNATPTLLVMADDAADLMVLEPDSCIIMKGTVIARCHADSDWKSWEVTAMYSRVGSGNPTLVDSVSKTVFADSAGAAAWDVNLVIDTTADAITVEATGAVAKSIRWAAQFSVVQVANN